MRILIVEDNMIIAEDIKLALKAKKHEVVGIATTIQTAMEILDQHDIDLALVDIMLDNGDSGIQLGKIILTTYNIPYLFLTSHGDEGTVKQALNSEPNGYLLKPFEREELYVAIEIARINFYNNNSETENPQESVSDSIFVKHKSVFTKVQFMDILFVKSDGNYIELHTSDYKKYILRKSIKAFTDSTGSNLFFQTNRSYAVNVKKVDGVGRNFVNIGDQEIPLGKEQRQKLIEILPLIK